LIQLKNGGQFLTPRYWEEGDEIKFYLNGQVMGIERDAVMKIEKSTREPRSLGYEEERQETVPTEKPIESPSVAPEAEASQTPTKESVQIDPGKDPDVMQQINELEKRFAVREGMTVDELEKLRDDLTALRDELASRYPEEEYGKLVTELSDMRFFTMDILKRSKNR
jgi:hypothetical protein